MREGFQSSRQSRAAHARTQGSSPDPHARRCLNSSCPQPKLAVKTPFLSSRPNHAMFQRTVYFYFYFFLKFFYHLASPSSLASLLVRSLLYLGTSIRWDIATSITGQGQFLLIVVVHIRRYDYASFTMSPPRHSAFSFSIL